MSLPVDISGCELMQITVPVDGVCRDILLRFYFIAT